MCLAALGACSSSAMREEAWNSYYYGAPQHHPGGDSYFSGYLTLDNDSTYELPNGPWSDENTPQGQIW